MQKKNHPKLSEKIREIRESKGLSQEYVSAVIGISQQAYSRIENHPNRSSLNRLKEVCKVLKIDLVNLLDSKSVPSQRAKPNQQKDNLYERLINVKNDEIEYLRSLVKSEKDLQGRLEQLI